jgi:hypothetical protein
MHRARQVPGLLHVNQKFGFPYCYGRDHADLSPQANGVPCAPPPSRAPGPDRGERTGFALPIANQFAVGGLAWARRRRDVTALVRRWRAVVRGGKGWENPAADCTPFVGSVVDLPPHSATLGLRFYTGDQARPRHAPAAAEPAVVVAGPTYQPGANTVPVGVP